MFFIQDSREEGEPTDPLALDLLDDDGATTADARNNPYGASADHLSRILISVFYHGNAYLMWAFVHGHPRKVRRLLQMIFMRVFNRLYTPCRQTVDLVRLLAQNIDNHLDSDALPSLKREIVEKNTWAALPLMFMAMNLIEQRVVGQVVKTPLEITFCSGATSSWRVGETQSF